MTEMQHIPEQSPFNYADLIDYREGQITSLALLRSKGVNITILAFDDEQLLPTHQTPGPALVQVVDGTAYFTIGNAEADLSQGRSADDPGRSSPLRHSQGALQNAGYLHSAAGLNGIPVREGPRREPLNVIKSQFPDGKG